LFKLTEVIIIIVIARLFRFVSFILIMDYETFTTISAIVQVFFQVIKKRKFNLFFFSSNI